VTGARSGMPSDTVRLVLVATCPMHRMIPLYRRLADDPHIDFSVIYASDAGVRPAAAGYASLISWDVDLESGYRHVYLKRSKSNPIDGGFLSLRDTDVVQKLHGLRPDVVWILGYAHLTHMLAALSARGRSIPVLYSDDQTLLHARPLWKQAIKRPLLRMLFHDQRALFVGSQNQLWFQSYGVHRARMFHMPYACDDVLPLERDALRGQRAELRTSFSISADAGPVVLTVSRLIDKKQPLLLLEAFARVRAQTQCCLLIVGSGPLEEAMREVVQQRSIPDVVFAGFINQTQIARAYAASDIFVLASRVHETWGMAVNEAMTFDLPVILSDKVGAAYDLVRDGYNGFVVPADRVDTLSRRMYDLVVDSDLRARLSANASDLLAGHTYDVAANAVLDATADAVGPGRWARAHDVVVPGATPSPVDDIPTTRSI
jgi:glycosyltransferase involved in cell wall biosynthesis